MMVSKSDRLDELLALRATQPLSAAERRELEALLATDVASDNEIFDRAAAAIHVAALRTRHTLPAALRARLEEQAANHFTRRDPDAAD